MLLAINQYSISGAFEHGTSPHSKVDFGSQKGTKSGDKIYSNKNFKTAKLKEKNKMPFLYIEI